LIENLNSQLVKNISKVKRWINSDMRARWVAVASILAEERVRKVNVMINYIC